MHSSKTSRSLIQPQKIRYIDVFYFLKNDTTVLWFTCPPIWNQIGFANECS